MKDVFSTDILASLDDAIVTTDPQERVTFLNPAAEKLFGTSQPEALGQPFSAPFHIAWRPTDAEHTSLALQQHGRWQGERPVMRKDGRQLTVHWTISVLNDTAGLRIGTLHVARDVTERHAALEHLEMLAAFPKWNPNPVLEFAADGRLLYFNEAALEMTANLGREALEELIPAETPGLVRECLQSGQPRLRLEREYGERVISWSFFPIRPLGVVHCYAGDVTERRGLEQQLRQSQKLESLGRLAGGVAHDFNNLLTVIKGQASCIASGELPPESHAEALQHILLAAERGSNLTRQLLAFSRQQMVQFRSLDLNEIIRHIDKLLSRVVGEHIQFDLKPAESLPPIWADVSMLEQVLLNLAVNARDAMQAGGQIIIETECTEVAPEYATRNPDARPGRFVCLTFKDTGSGISPANLPRIFEPFFTTKGVGKGTGLGLATVYGIVKQHNGWVRVFSEVGRGTTFQIYLPCTDRPLSINKEKKGEVGPYEAVAAHETILVVEDEPPVRKLIVSALRNRGYQVHEASNGSAALELWEQVGSKVDLLLSDVVMPGGINGRELAVQLSRKKPGLRVLLITGYSPDFLNDGLRDRLKFSFLPKPFDLDELCDALREALV